VQQPQEKLSQELFKAFSLGDVKKINSTPDHKPPTQEDTIEGRYASVLFTSASQAGALYTIYEDIAYIKMMYDNSESFKMFTQNAGVGTKEIRAFNEALQTVGEFHPLTIKFLEVLAENKRLIYISGIAERYKKLYQQFNREEKITIISANPLSSAEQSEVLGALKANPENVGKEFTLDFTVDPAIRGGLQMYTETEFMDMSLASRVDRLKSEVSKLIE
jgi:ATP synthase F1 delta subunit